MPHKSLFFLPTKKMYIPPLYLQTHQKWSSETEKNVNQNLSNIIIKISQKTKHSKNNAEAIQSFRYRLDPRKSLTRQNSANKILKKTMQ